MRSYNIRVLWYKGDNRLRNYDIRVKLPFINVLTVDLTYTYGTMCWTRRHVTGKVFGFVINRKAYEASIA